MESTDNEIKLLLERLTWWHRASEIDPEAASEVKSTGEANAAIGNLKLELDRLGAHYYWHAAEREFRLKVSREQAEEEE